MAAARKHGREYAITGAVTEIITIPVGDEGVGQTLINDGTSDIFWREYDPTITLTGAAAVLVATPIFASRLQPGEYTHQAGITIVAISDTDEQETSTLRVAPGRLYQSGDVDIASLATVVHNEDDAYTAKDAGIPPLAVRKDTGAMPAAAADGDYTPLQTDATGQLRTVDDDAIALLTTIDADTGDISSNVDFLSNAAYAHGDSTYTVGVDNNGVEMLGVRTDTRASLGDTTNQFVPMQMTANGDVRTRDDDANTALDSLVTQSGAPATALTFTRVKIDQTAGAGVTALIAALASNYTRLHALFGTMEAQGTLTVEDSDGTDITGPMPWGAGAGIVIPYERDKDGTPISLISKGMSINTTQKFYGHAIVSQSTTA